jgi:hypothetical protein
MRLTALALASLLLLAGCGSSPSVEDQIKLIEYENCLIWEREVWIAQSKDWSASTIDDIKERIEKEGRVISDYDIIDCLKFLP